MRPVCLITRLSGWRSRPVAGRRRRERATWVTLAGSLWPRSTVRCPTGPTSAALQCPGPGVSSGHRKWATMLMTTMTTTMIPMHRMAHLPSWPKPMPCLRPRERWLVCWCEPCFWGSHFSHWDYFIDDREICSRTKWNCIPIIIYFPLLGPVLFTLVR